MVTMIQRLFRRNEPARVHFESGAVPLALATDLLRGSPERERNLSSIRNLLAAIPKAEKETYIDRVVHRFVLYAMDLPASERFHHAQPFGLVDHSLEVARIALERAQDHRFITSHDPVVNHEMQPRWVYGVFVAALLHDIGKVADVEVDAPDGSTWNCFVEPLAGFYERHGDPAHIRHRPGRGLEGHELQKSFFFSVILPVESRQYLGPIQSHLLVGQSEAAAAVNRLWKLADNRSAQEDSSSSTWDSFVDAFRRATEERLLEGQTFIGERYVAITYPAGIVAVLGMIRRVWAARMPEFRAFTPDEAGARKIMQDFVRQGRLFVEPESSAWSFECTIEGSRSTPAVLIPKERLAPGQKPSGIALRFANRETHREIAIADFQVAPAAGRLAEGTHKELSRPASALPAARATDELDIDAVTILTDIRGALRSGLLTANVRYKAEVYLTATHAHIVTPRALDMTASTRGYRVRPSDALNPYLNLLGRNPLIEHAPDGKVIHPIYTFPTAMRHVDTIRVKLAGWLSREEIESYGLWDQPITEATTAEQARRAAARRRT